MNAQPSMPPAPRRKRHPVLFTFLFLLVFACGIAVGAGATLYVVQRMLTELVREPDKMADRIARRMERTLRLSDEQAAQVEAVITRRVDALLDIRRDIRPRVVEQLDLLEAEMRQVLTDDQMREWQKQLDRIKEILVAPEDE